MKRILMLFLALLFVVSITACTTPNPPDNGTTETVAKIDSVKYSREGTNLVIEVNDSDYKNTDLGVVILVNKHFKDSWKNDPSVLIDLGQISLDENGKGSITLTVPEKYTRFAFCITAPDCEYVESVGG